MNRISSPLRGVVAGLLAVAALALAFAPSASAQAALPAACEDQVAERPFMPWADPAHYVLVPNGTVEQAADWELEGGAARVAGNETFHVNDVDDTSSLRPAARLVGHDGADVRRSRAPDAAPVRAQPRRAASRRCSSRCCSRTPTAGSRALPIGAYFGTSAWQPTTPLAVIANLFAAPTRRVTLTSRSASRRWAAPGAGRSTTSTWIRSATAEPAGPP